jgi:ribonucleoside-diphosphate reductase alpha chain
MTVINDNVQKLLEKRYFLRDNQGELLEHSWSDIAKRVSYNIAQADDEKNITYYSDKFYEKINNMEFIPSSPCIFNAGTKSQSLSSCFIVDIEDNIEGIFQTVAECAKIFQMSGGAGFSMRKIRPKGASCNSSGSTASGVVSFMNVFNEVVNRVKQGNKRNGALKIDLPCDHPEIFDFIHSKDDTTQLNNMNISVSITDEFIKAVESNSNWDLKFKGEVFKTIKAKDLWNEIMFSAWKTAEPGISYQTSMDAGNMNTHICIDVYGNPCHEFVNIPYSSCNLLSLHLVKVIKKGKVNWNLLEENIKIAFRFLDNMITMNRLPLPKIEEITKAIRPIGLGTMGFAQLLYMLKIPYNSQECLNFIDELYGFIDKTALKYNIELATERGVYPAWKGSKWEERNLKVRCSSMTSIAPNGSIAFIANTTGGIEPQYALVYKRRDKENDEYMIADDVFEEYLKTNKLFTEEILNKINSNGGSIKGLDDIFTKEIQNIFVTANDISPEWHVRVLAQIQKYVSLSISKTVNMPKEATVEDVADVYLMAARSGIKGITVYRDGCRENQVLSTGNTVKEEIVEEVLPRGHVIKAPTEADGRTYKFVSGCGNAYLGVNWDEKGNINQTFTNKGSSGTCKSNQEAVSRLVSLSLRGGIPIEKIIDQLESVDVCSAYTNARTKGKPVSKGASCPHAIANILKRAIKDVNKKFENVDVKTVVKELISIDVVSDSKYCPECKEPLINEGSCICCKSCGYSKCE